MITQDIKSLVVNCLAQLRKSGHDERSIERHRHRLQSGIVTFMEKKGYTQFSHDVGEEFLATVLPGLAPSSQRAHTRIIHVLDEYLNTGNVRTRIVQLHDYPLDGEIGAVVAEHLDDLKIHRRASITIKNHRRLLYFFISGLKLKGITKVSEITEDAIVDYLDYAQTSKKERFYAIKQFCTYLYDHKLTSINFGYVLSTNHYPQREKLPSVYSAEEIQIIDASIEQSSAVGKRDYAIFLLASRLGLRASDIANLTWSNIDWDNGKITICQQKTKNLVELPLLKELGEAIVSYARDARPKSDKNEVFLSAKTPCRPMTGIGINGVITRIMRASKVDISGRHYGPHSLRHSLASNLLRKGTTLPTISSVLGHESTQSTMEYLRVDVWNLKECVLEAPLVDEAFYSQKGGVFYD
jgi:integrase